MTGPRGPTEGLRESDVQLSVRRLLESVGCHVYALSQGRTTRQSKGLPDLWVMHPTKGAWWVEVKQPGGRASEAQLQFADRCRAAGVPYVLCADLRTLDAFLRRQGVIAETV